MIYKHNQSSIPEDVKKEIQSICAGYYRRKRIADMRLSVLTAPPSEELIAFMSWNKKIDKALDFIEEGIRPYILNDIANGKGYWGSMGAPLISKDSYYARKNKALKNLTVELNLMI